LPVAAMVCSLVRGYVTDPAGPAGLRLTDGLPEPGPADNEAIVEVKAFAINHDEPT
jgi:NADPH:quinone reductase